MRLQRNSITPPQKTVPLTLFRRTVFCALLSDTASAIVGRPLISVALALAAGAFLLCFHLLSSASLSLGRRLLDAPVADESFRVRAALEVPAIYFSLAGRAGSLLYLPPVDRALKAEKSSCFHCFGFDSRSPRAGVSVAGAVRQA